MKIKSDGIMRRIQWSFALLAIGVFLFFLSGELFLPSEGEITNQRCEILEAEWEQVFSNGQRVPVEVPGEYAAGRGETVRIETTLPAQIAPGAFLCVRSSMQTVDLYIDGKMRTHYSTQGSMPFGKNSISAYVFLQLKEEDAGKTLALESVSDSIYSGTLSTVYMGDRMSIWLHFIRKYGWQFLIAVFMLVLSLISIIVSMVVRIGYKKNITLEYLGWGILLTAVWIITGSKLRQLIFPNYSVIYNISFFVAMLIPIPFLIYMNGIQKGRYRKWYVLVSIMAIINFMVCTGLQAANMVDFLDSMILIHLVIGVGILLIAVTTYRDMIKGYSQEYRLVSVGLAGMLITACSEIGMLYVKGYMGNGLMLSVGLIFLLVMAASQSGQDIMKMEREKQKMILAGESKSRFLANMSHEIRTPIHTILGMNEMILRESGEEEIRAYARNIQKDGRTLLALINDVLDFSHVEAGTLELEEREYYLASLLNDVVHVLKARADDKNLQVNLNIEPKLPSLLYGDDIRMKQILMNLLTNAVKYTDEGAITFSVQEEMREGNRIFLKLSVADTGRGIREEDMEKLYESFSRLEEKKNYSIKGAGLGLSITRQLVERMEGVIQVQSLYGKGSLFTVRIPQRICNGEVMGDLQIAYEEEMRTFEGEKIVYAPNASVLAVDDNEMNLAVVKGLLKQSGVRLDTALGGEEGLEYSRKKKYDLIFMDHMMPEPDGIETLHLIKQEENNPNRDTKVIVLTANAVTGSRENYLKEGFADYLTKPIEIGKLEKMLQTYLDTESVSVESIAVKTEEDVKTEENETAFSFIDRKLGMTYCANQEEMFYEMLGAFQEQGEQYINQLTKFYQERDWKNYAIKVHAVKSTSLTIGAKSFSEQAREQEMEAKEGKEELLLAQWDGFLEDFQALLEEVNQILLGAGKKAADEAGASATEEQIPGESVSEETFAEKCTALLEYIRAYEMNEALELAEQMKHLSVEGREQKEVLKMLEQVQSAVDDFDYDRAEACLVKWMEVIALNCSDMED